MKNGNWYKYEGNPVMGGGKKPEHAMTLTSVSKTVCTR